MKNSVKKFLLLFIVVGTFSSCSKDDEVYTTIDLNRFTEIVTNGNWKVSNFDGGSSQLSAYNISFGPNFSINANNGNESASGSWDIWLNDNGDGEFRIHFSTLNDLQMLNNTWGVISYSNNKMQFYGRENGGSLTLSRN